VEFGHRLFWGEKMGENKKIIDPLSSNEIQLNDKLFKEFGLEKIPTNHGIKHRLFEREIIIAQRDLKKILQQISTKQPFLQMTGIAASGKLHLGHKVDIDLFLLFKELGALSFFGVCDIDAFCSRPDNKISSMKQAKENAVDNISHLLALGVEAKDIYIQSKKESRYYELAFEVSKRLTENEFKAIYGHVNLGKVSANILQYADILHQQLEEYQGPMPSITGIGLDQDPHARATRDIAKRLPYHFVTPSFIYFKHQRGLQEGKKMSSSEPDTAIFLSDTQEEVKRKINKAFSGGRNSLEEHKRLGGIPEIDRAFEILNYHHSDSGFVKKVYDDYKSGKMTTGELKQITLEFLISFLSEHQAKVKSCKQKAREMVFLKEVLDE